ncbi:MAG: pentapeptide repeat-containing protein [Armatimonadetes bacterium]|nr:pentapeptide repeat-containing protein [Armatimonadota bacterium]
MADPKHVAILRQGVPLWNQWRTENPAIEPDLSGLSDQDLERSFVCPPGSSHTILRGMNFQSVSLRQCTFFRADLTGADLSGASLSQARFIQANLNEVSFRQACLTSADLRDTSVFGADFTGAIMGWTTLGNIDFSEAKGLESVIHEGRSVIGMDTYARSQGLIPEAFLRQAGFSEQPTEDPQIRRLESLLSYPREDLDIELKGWLNLTTPDDKANLAQALIALANHGGGYIVLGYQEDNEKWIPAAPRPTDMRGYTQDLMNGIAERYAEPVFPCERHLVRHPQQGDLFPVIVVPEGKVPIRAKRDGPDKRHVRNGTYYIRRPGPKSEAPQSGQEWDQLIGRCVRLHREELLEQIRAIMLGGMETVRTPSPEENAMHQLQDWVQQPLSRWEALVNEKHSEKPSFRFLHGSYAVAYLIMNEVPQSNLPQFIEILHQVEGHETGWPPWWVPTRDEIKPYPMDHMVECWLAELGTEPYDSDFWRASPDGRMFLLRGYQEDSDPGRAAPGTLFDAHFPIWRVSECLLHADRLTKALCGDRASILFQVTWNGLAGRMLSSWSQPGSHLFRKRKASQDSVSATVTVSPEQISVTLPEIVQRLTTPLYEVFDFYAMPLETIQAEIAQLRQRRF